MDYTYKVNKSVPALRDTPYYVAVPFGSDNPDDSAAFNVDVHSSSVDTFEAHLLCHALIAVLKELSLTEDVSKTLNRLIDIMAKELKDYL